MSASYLTIKAPHTAATPVNLKGGTVYMTVFGADLKMGNNASDVLTALGTDGAQQFYLPASTEPGTPMARDGPQIYKFKGLGERIFIAGVGTTATVTIMEL